MGAKLEYTSNAVLPFVYFIAFLKNKWAINVNPKKIKNIYPIPRYYIIYSLDSAIDSDRPFKVMIIQVISYTISVQYMMQHGPNVKFIPSKCKNIITMTMILVAEAPIS